MAFEPEQRPSRLQLANRNVLIMSKLSGTSRLVGGCKDAPVKGVVNEQRPSRPHELTGTSKSRSSSTELPDLAENDRKKMGKSQSKKTNKKIGLKNHTSEWRNFLPQTAGKGRKSKRSLDRISRKSKYHGLSNLAPDPETSWPSIQDIFDRVHRNLSYWKKEEVVDYDWRYFHNAENFRTDEKKKKKPTTAGTDFVSRIVFKKVDTSSFKRAILAISVKKADSSDIVDIDSKRTLTTSSPHGHTRHLRRLHEHLKVLSATKAKLHHRWLQKEKFENKILT